MFNPTDDAVNATSDPWQASSNTRPLSIEEIRELLAVDRNSPPVTWDTDTDKQSADATAEKLSSEAVIKAMNAETRDRASTLFSRENAFDPFAETLRASTPRRKRATRWSDFTAFVSRLALPLMALALYFSALPLLRDIVQTASSGQSLWQATGNWLHIGNPVGAEMAGLAYWWVFLPLMVVGWRYFCARRAARSH